MESLARIASLEKKIKLFKGLAEETDSKNKTKLLRQAALDIKNLATELRKVSLTEYSAPKKVKKEKETDGVPVSVPAAE